MGPNGQSTQAQRLLTTELPRLAAAHDVPGVSAAVLVDGQVVEGVAGVLNLRTGVPVTPDSLFMIQSITKLWTASLVMQLVDDGLVDLDVPVRRYVPAFRTTDESASAQVTVRQLLTHTGGFEGDIWGPTTSGDDALQRFVEDLVPGAQQFARPGEMFSYCSAGYGVLGHLVELFRGGSYAEVLRSHLADPLGIEEIAFSADEALAFRTAIGHAHLGAEAARQEPLNSWAVMPPSNPAAGNQLAMSARALIAFAHLHVADGLVGARRLLSARSTHAMRERQAVQPVIVDEPTGQGLGWMLPPQPGVIEHGGGVIGSAALLRIMPERGIAVAVLANGGSAGLLFRELVDRLSSDLAGVAPSPRLPAPDARARVSEPERFVGLYESRPTRLEVTTDDAGRLWLTESDREEALSLARRAGVIAVPRRHELRQVRGGSFVLVGDSGAPVRAVQFLGGDASGRAHFLHTGRAAPRVY